MKTVDVEIKKFCNNSINNYCIDCKNMYNEGVDIEVQLVLFPKKYIDLFSELCDKIVSSKKYFNITAKIIN